MSTNEEVIEESNEEVEEKPNPNEGKPTKSREEIEKEALYRWQIEEDMEIVLTREDGEISRHDITSAIGEKVMSISLVMPQFISSMKTMSLVIYKKK